MIQTNDIRKYCLDKHKSYEDFPFGDIPVCYKLNGKIFAQLYPNENDYMAEWNFENWGIKYWSKTPEFMEYVKAH